VLLDNRSSGDVGNELKKRSFDGSKLSVLSGLFTIYGYAALRKELAKLADARLLLTSWQNQTLQSLIGTEDEVRLLNQLDQRRVAEECAKWVRSGVEVKARPDHQQSAQNLKRYKCGFVKTFLS